MLFFQIKKGYYISWILKWRAIFSNYNINQHQKSLEVPKITPALYDAFSGNLKISRLLQNIRIKFLSFDLWGETDKLHVVFVRAGVAWVRDPVLHHRDRRHHPPGIYFIILRVYRFSFADFSKNLFLNL